MTDTIKKQIAEEVFENLNWNNMDLIIIKDGEDIDWEIRLKNHYSLDGKEELIVGTIDLEKWYWDDILADWGIEDKNEIDEDLKEEFICNVIIPMIDQYI